MYSPQHSGNQVYPQKRFVRFALAPQEILLFILLKMMHLLHHLSRTIPLRSQTSAESEERLAENILQNAEPPPGV